MKLENQVISVEQAKILRGLGVEQTSLIQCIDYGDYYIYKMAGNVLAVFEHVAMRPIKTREYKEVYAMFTVAELGVMLPDGDNKTYTQFSSLRISKEYSIETGKYGYVCIADCMSETVQAPYFEKIAPTEAEARAAMLIYLLENNLTTAAEVNERLKLN